MVVAPSALAVSKTIPAVRARSEGCVLETTGPLSGGAPRIPLRGGRRVGPRARGTAGRFRWRRCPVGWEAPLGRSRSSCGRQVSKLTKPRTSPTTSPITCGAVRGARRDSAQPFPCGSDTLPRLSASGSRRRSRGPNGKTSLPSPTARIRGWTMAPGRLRWVLGTGRGAAIV